MQLLNEYNAYPYVLKHLAKRGYFWRQVLPLDTEILIGNKKKLIHNYHLIIGEPSILIMFKKELFHAFGHFYNQGREEGETVNLTELKYAYSHNVQDLYFVYPSGEIKTISLQDFLSKCFKRQTLNEEKAVRHISVEELTTIVEGTNTQLGAGNTEVSAKTIQKPLLPSL